MAERRPGDLAWWETAKKSWVIPVAAGLLAVGLVIAERATNTTNGSAPPTAASSTVSPVRTAPATTAAPSSELPTVLPTVLPTTNPSVVTTTSTVVVTTTAPATTQAPTTAASTTTTPTLVTVPPTTAATAPPTPPATTAPPALLQPGPPVAPARWAVFSDGNVFLRGVVPDDATAAIIVTKAAKIVGADHVFDEYTRIPGAAVPKSAPLFVADTILFGSNNATIYPEFEGILNLGVVLLKTFPTVTVTIRGHTDSQGTAAGNAKLAERRVQAVIDHLVAAGVDTSRLVGQPIGAEEPIADNQTHEGRQLNRRIEFVVDGLLDA